MADRKAYFHQYHKEWYLKVIKPRKENWFKENGPCKMCGSWDRLELDHIDPTQKISHNVWTWAEEKRNAELAKCQVLCYDCHKDKTYQDILKLDIWKDKRKYVVDGKLWCHKCESMVSTSNFNKDKYSCSGYYAVCKPCRKNLKSRKSKKMQP